MKLVFVVRRNKEKVQRLKVLESP